MRLANILIKKGLVNQEQIDRALELKATKNIRLDQALIETGAITEKELLTLLGEHFNMPVVSLTQVNIDPEAKNIMA